MYPDLIFCKRYNYKGETRFTFRKAILKKEISKELGSWLATNYINMFQSNNIEEYNMKNIDTWNDFEEKFNNMEDVDEEEEFKSLGSNLIALCLNINYIYY